MRKRFLTRFLWAILLLGMMPVARLGALTIWNGAVTADVTDDDIDITGNVQLGDGANQNVVVFADSADVTMTVVGADRTILANDGAGEVALNLRASAGRTIYIDVDQSLILASNNLNFVVSFAGPGSLVVRIADGERFILRGNGNTGTGTYFMNVMAAAGPTVTFERQSNASDADTIVQIEEDCLMGFLGTDTTLATETGTIVFNSSNNVANTGRMMLWVQPAGGMSIEGHLTSEATTPLAADIDFTTLAGAGAVFETSTNGSGAWSGLMVLNTNSILPVLRSNPWCEDDQQFFSPQPGFILGRNGSIVVDDKSYIDYIAGAVNTSPTPTIPADVLEKFEVNGVVPQVNTLVKDRNASALFVDGPRTMCVEGIFPSINMNGDSKIYFRSACDDQGLSSNPDYIVDPDRQFTEEQGFGSIVFDVEGVVDVFGSAAGETALNILSLQEANVGGSVLIEGTDTVFKLRTYAKTNDVYNQYGKGCFMVNGRMNLYNTCLQHTDAIHKVYDKNIGDQSEATYIGGESFRLCEDRRRPTIAYYNSRLLIHDSVAFTGVDQLTPSYSGENNYSYFTFYYNGYGIDSGTGRSMILGTNIGALASDMGTIINRDAHFDLYEEYANTSAKIVGTILTAPNNSKVTEGLTTDVTGQYSVHSFFLGYGTNVSIGTNASVGTNPCNAQETFTLTSTPDLFINGDFISFETQGGLLNKPDTSIVTGEGAIFVDNMGIFELAHTRRLSIACMIGTGYNGIVDIKKREVFFDSRVGITRSILDLSQSAQRTIIPSGSNIPDFTLDWKYTQRDSTFVPYAPASTPAACDFTDPVAANIATIPVISGTVDQFQIRNSRLGDPAHVKVSDGRVYEFVMLTGDDAGVAPVAMLVLENDCFVGLGTAQSNVDSTMAEVVLGLNGITLIPNGNAHVILNSARTTISNECPIVPGPDFGAAAAQELYISSEIPREIRVKRGGVLDLTGFNTANKKCVIGGEVSLVFEPGSYLALGAGELVITDNASIRFEPFIDQDLPTGTSVASTDLYRVRVGGTGTIRVEEDAQVLIPRGACVGIESLGVVTVADPVGEDQNNVTLLDCSYITNQTWIFEDNAELLIGGPGTLFGGSLQVGNVTDQSAHDATVTWTLTIDGVGAKANINSQGFLGLGVGIVDKRNNAPNSWIVGPLYNTAAVTINVTEGVFSHNSIYTGTDVNASLFAIGQASTGFTHSYDGTNGRIIGGGNMAYITAQGNPTVTTTDSTSAGIMASMDVLLDSSKSTTPPTFPTTGALLFTYLKANAYGNQIGKIAQVGQKLLGTLTLGLVAGTTIKRDDIEFVYGGQSKYVDPTRSLEFGAVAVALSDINEPTAYAIHP